MTKERTYFLDTHAWREVMPLPNKDGSVKPGAWYVREDWANAEITQLRGNLSLAEEGLANYALEVERVQMQLRVVIAQRDEYKDDYLRIHKQLVDLKYPGTVPAHEPGAAQRCDYVGMYDGQCGLDLGHAGEHRLFGPHRGAVKSEASLAPYAAQHVPFQGETEWVFQQTCQCSACRAEYARFLVLQNAQKSAASPDPCFCECHGATEPCRKVADCELCSPSRT